MPWTLRLFAAVPLPPIAVGIALAALLVAIYLGVEYATGQIARVLAGEAEAHIPVHLRTATINSILLAYLATAPVYLIRCTRKRLAELGPLAQPSSADPTGPPTAAVMSHANRVAGTAGILMTVVIFHVIPGNLPRFSQSDYWIFEHSWENLMLVPVGWLAGRFVYALVADARRIGRLAAGIGRIDLFDRSSLVPFVRQGLHSALLAIILFSIVLGHAANTLVVSFAALMVSLSGMLALATAALLLPVLGAHRRIREEKRDTLTKLRATIRTRQQTVIEASGGMIRATSELPGLLALESRIQAASEWPFDASTLWRFSLYVAIGVGSWLGAAAVERLLDIALR